MIAVLNGDGSAESSPEHDGMKRLVERVLLRLRDEGRRAIRIVDVDCGTGRRLAGVVRRARALGFTAIEARGYARSPEAAVAAARAGAHHPDPAVGWDFDMGIADEALATERSEGDADLILAPDMLAHPKRARPAPEPIGRTRRVRAAMAASARAGRAKGAKHRAGPGTAAATARSA